MPVARTPTPKLRASVTASVDAPQRLYPYLGELFAGLTTLGASTSLVVRRLQAIGLVKEPAGKCLHAIDLGCGPGGVAVALARTLHMRTMGVDGCPAFIKSAKALAVSAGVAQHCEFFQASLESFVRSASVDRGFDLALMLNVWPALRAARAARRFVRIGGVYMIDDAVRREGNADPSLRGVPTLASISERLEAFGDAVLDARTIAPSTIARMESALQRQLKVNAKRLARRHPLLTQTIRDFVRGQQDSADLLDGPLRGAIWVVRRGA